jgi:hypothetical protein
VVEVTMAEEDVTDAARVDVAGQQASHHAQTTAGVEQHPWAPASTSMAG